jgi:hypothetical protein
MLSSLKRTSLRTLAEAASCGARGGGAVKNPRVLYGLSYEQHNVK